ncbi:proline racemase family protein [Kribbella sp. NBC_00889]|uniref:proline racemase family protein n=1 Tax=Kribbella sp. NBC_00889 TaxID=2975974 RepID=UPI00386CD244|nr:proline racemase family protein [Kribbella sp. NBC_00889]
MTATIVSGFVAEGTSEGQPVACYDLTSSEQCDGEALELVQADYFKTRGGDPSAIVAVVFAPSTDDADYGLRFVAAHGPLGGCGEATLFATAMCTNPSTDPAVTFETAAGVIVGRNLSSGRVAVDMPAVARTSVRQQVDYLGRPLRIRSASAGGNRFAAVTASDLGTQLDRFSFHELTVAGHDLLSRLRGPASDIPAPDMLLITEPVTGLSTRSAVVWGDGVLNRGPCGTGTCVRYVLAVEDGEVCAGAPLVHASPFGHSFEAQSIGSGTIDQLDIMLSGLVTMD